MDNAEANTSRPEKGGLKGVRAGRERVEVATNGAGTNGCAVHRNFAT